MNKEIEVNGKKFIVRELLAIEVDMIDFSDKVEATKKQVLLSTGISEDEYKSLTWNARKIIFQAINEVNGLNPISPTN